nr:type 1 glutamine amidotransferase [Pseudonocardia sp. C8]
MPDPRGYDLVVPLGCYASAYDESLPFLRREQDLLTAAVESGVAVFGICFGAQLLARVLGGEVHPSPGGPEIGWLEVETAPQAAGTVEPGPWLVWHLDVISPPADGVELAWTGVGTQAFRHGRHLGVQFHPEATLDSVRSWADHYRDLLLDIGPDPDEIVATTRRTAAETARRAYVLTDRVLAAAMQDAGRPA